MKRLFLFGLLVLGGVKAWGYSDFYGNLYTLPAPWRSSITCATENLVTITTRTVNFGGIIVSSAGTSSQAAAFDITNTLIISSIDTTAKSAFPYGYGVHVGTAGLVISNITIGGTPACITTLWQYQYQPDAGK